MTDKSFEDWVLKSLKKIVETQKTEAETIHDIVNSIKSLSSMHSSLIERVALLEEAVSILKSKSPLNRLKSLDSESGAV